MLSFDKGEVGFPLPSCWEFYFETIDFEIVTLKPSFSGKARNTENPTSLEGWTGEWLKLKFSDDKDVKFFESESVDGDETASFTSSTGK